MGDHDICGETLLGLDQFSGWCNLVLLIVVMYRNTDFFFAYILNELAHFIYLEILLTFAGHGSHRNRIQTPNTNRKSKNVKTSVFE